MASRPNARTRASRSPSRSCRRPWAGRLRLDRAEPVHGEGDYLGEPFLLEPWQKRIIYRLYEYDPKTGAASSGVASSSSQGLRQD